MEGYAKTALSFGNTKEAALYFDHVVPISLVHEFLPRIIEGKSDLISQEEGQIIAALAPDILRTNAEYNRQMRSVQLLWVTFLEELIDHPEISEMSEADVMIRFPNNINKLSESLTQLTERFGLAEAPVVLSNAFLVSGRSVQKKADTVGDVALTLCELHLIDVSKASWEQVLELRRDPEAQQKLRRLRTFAAENYSGKSKSYVEDDLSRRIYDYEEEARRWRFETIHSALTMLVTSKTMGTAFAGSLLSVLFGAPAVAVTAALGGACVEIGRIVLEVSYKRFALRNALQDNPISYLVSTNKRLKQGIKR